MAFFDEKFVSNKQDWETPDDLFNLLNNRYDFNFDLAANKKNTKTKAYYSEKDNSLKKRWSGRCWLNPPYGGVKDNRLELWIKKAYLSAKKDSKCSVTLLIPARTNTNWFHKYCMRAKEILFIKGRPKFKGAKYGLPQPLIVVHFEKTNKKVVCLTLDFNKGVIE
jgi:phage N-6-adenine-methyltransferase